MPASKEKMEHGELGSTIQIILEEGGNPKTGFPHKKRCS